MAAAVTVVCPSCSNRMRASSEHIGRRGRCPNCKALVEIRASAGEESLVTVHPTGTTVAARNGDARLSSTTVSTWKAGVLAVIAAAFLYAAVFLPLRHNYLGQLFIERGCMQYCTTLVACWGLAILAMKYRAVRKQMSYAELELELIPLEIGLQITPGNVDQFLGHLAKLPRRVRLSVLGRRIQGALEHFKSRNNVPEVQQYLTTQAELDASGVDSGYTLLRAFIWVIPLLGFIGTVTGISSAVSGLDAAIREAGGHVGGEQLMHGLTLVTSGLAVAFDTTFLALVMAIVLLFPTESLRRIEYGVLDRIEAFANESLLRRMVDEPEPASDKDLPDVVRKALEGAFREHQRWLAQWQAQVGQLGQAIGRDFEAAATRVQQQMSQADVARLEKFSGLSHLVEEIFTNVESTTQRYREACHGALAQSQNFLETVSKVEQALARSATLCEEICRKQDRFWETYSAGGLDNHLTGLATQVGKLTAYLDGSQRSAGAAPRQPTDVIEPVSLPSDGTASPPESRRGLLARFWGRHS